MSVRRNSILIVVSIVAMLVSGLGSALLQSAGNSIAVKDLRWETPSGHLMSALLFVPPNATSTHRAPAVVTAHGMYNSREMQDSTYIELARRGYVVLAVDMLGHGFSDVVTAAERDAARATGVYDGVDLVARLPYVDRGRIGLTGHSFGARSANWSMEYDNARAEPLVSAVLLQAADAEYVDEASGRYVNLYRSRDVGIIADRWDEFFFRQERPDGSFTKPRDYLSTDNAQSFLHFGANPAGVDGSRVADRVYSRSVDGERATREIYQVPMTHQWVPFSATSTARVIAFFDRTLGAPTPRPPGDQVWQGREIFGGIGLLGWVIFLVAPTRALVRTAPFRAVVVSVPATASAFPDRRRSAWFWGVLAVTALVSFASYLLLFQPVQDLQPGFRTQYPPLFIGIWAAVNGLVALAVMALVQRRVGRRDGADARAAGLVLRGAALGRTILIAAVVVVVGWVVVSAVQWAFQSDFRFWVLAAKPFGSDRVWSALLMAPLFLVYFVASSLLSNVYGRFSIAGREWLGTLVVAAFTALPGVAVLLLQYVTFFTTGEMHPWIQPIEGIYMFSVTVILFASVIVSRVLYRATGNPWLGGIVTGLVATLMSIGNTQTLGI